MRISRFFPLLQNSDLAVIRQVGVLLQLARSLDRSMSGIINDLKVDIRGDDVIIKLSVQIMRSWRFMIPCSILMSLRKYSIRIFLLCKGSRVSAFSVFEPYTTHISRGQRKEGNYRR